MAAMKAQPGARTEQGRPERFGEALLRLRQIQSAVVVAVAALRQQNCELDEDIASVLQRSVADRLEDQIELLDTIGRTPSRQRRAGALRRKR